MPLRDVPPLATIVADLRAQLADRPHEPSWFLPRDVLEALLAAAERERQQCIRELEECGFGTAAFMLGSVAEAK